MSEFNGKVALISGSNSGIGRAIALKLTELGANVVIHGRDENRIQEVVKECRTSNPNGKYVGIRAELISDDDIKQLVDKAIKEFKRIDILVLNAGFNRISDIKSPDYIQDFDYFFAMKVRSAQVLTKLVLPYLIESKGNLINISGTGAVLPFRSATAHCMVESAMDMFIKCMALELGPEGVRCNSVLPGIINTTLLGTFGFKIGEYYKQRYPLRRIGEPQDVAEVVAFLVSTKASFLTGAMVPVDGGHLIAQIPFYQ